MRQPKDKEVNKYFQPTSQNGRTGIQAQIFLTPTRTLLPFVYTTLSILSIAIKALFEFLETTDIFYLDLSYLIDRNKALFELFKNTTRIFYL